MCQRYSRPRQENRNGAHRISSGGRAREPTDALEGDDLTEDRYAFCACSVGTR